MIFKDTKNNLIDTYSLICSESQFERAGDSVLTERRVITQILCYTDRIPTESFLMINEFILVP